MKKLITLTLLAFSLGVQAQTNERIITIFTNGLLPPNRATAPYIGNGSFWFDSVAGKLKTWGGSSWYTFAYTSDISSTNLALGTLTTTTIPINNSNGTGVTIPSAVAGVSAGLINSSDQTKLNAITGTNTGNQTLSTGTTSGGLITISGTGGNSINLRDLSLHGSTDFPDANVLPTTSGLFPNITTTGATNYPSAIGGSLKFMRTASSGLGYFEFWKSNTTANELWFRNGISASTFGAWDKVEGQNRAATLYAPIANPTHTGTTKIAVVEYADNAAAVTGGLAVGSVYRTGDILKIVH